MSRTGGRQPRQEQEQRAGGPGSAVTLRRDLRIPQPALPAPASPSYFLAAAASQQYCTAASSQQPDIAQWLLVPANWGQETGDVASYLNCRLGRAELLAAAVMLGTALDH